MPVKETPKSDNFGRIMTASIFPALCDVLTEGILYEENCQNWDFFYPWNMSNQVESMKALDERDFLNQQVLSAEKTDIVSSTSSAESDLQELSQPDDLMIPLMWPNVYDGQGGETLIVEYEVEVSEGTHEIHYAHSPGSAGEDSEFSSEPENECNSHDGMPPVKKVEVKTEPAMCPPLQKEPGFLPATVHGMLSPYEEEELEDYDMIHSDELKAKKKQRKSDMEYLADGRRRPGRKKGQTSSVYHLWEFIRDLLHDPKQRIIKWENEEEGIFRVVKSSEVAKQWGNMKKNREKMTYEKLSRSLRYSRKEGYFEDVPKGAGYPKKLCFKFGPKSHGWKRL